MTTLIFAIILVALLVVYYFSKKKTTSSVYIQCVEAGPTTILDAEELKKKSYYDRETTMRGLNGEVLSPAHYTRILVNGSCMTKKGVNDGDILIAQIYDKDTNFHSILKPGNVVWLHIEDTGMDKIRVFDRWDHDEMKTYYFQGDKKQQSSSNHHPSQIKGVVRYRV